MAIEAPKVPLAFLLGVLSSPEAQCPPFSSSESWLKCPGCHVGSQMEYRYKTHGKSLCSKSTTPSLMGLFSLTLFLLVDSFPATWHAWRFADEG